jgi:preprotein translocase subunit SecE
MAIKQKSQQQPNKLLEVISKDYRGESLILGIFATITAALAILIITRTPGFTIPADFPIIGGSPNDMIFAWTILTVAVLGVALVVYPFILPAVPEIKKIQWASWKSFLDHSVRTLIFIVLLTGMVFAFDVIIIQIIQWISR